MSTRGGPPRGRARARGNSAPTASRGAFARHGHVSGALRGSVIARGAFTQAPKGNAIRGRGSRVAKPTESNNGVAAARGSWQERYQELTKAREVERAQAIASGILAHPDKRRTLAEAVTPVGTCMDMCPEYERAERVDPNRSAYATADQEPDEARMVKKFHRPDAGAQEQLPSDLRPPSVLKQTIEFLFDDVLASATSLGKVHGFIWDRTRGIRNDFSIQQVTKPEDVQTAIDCYERIVRFHILSLHQLSVDPPISDKFSPFQEREQLDATLLSLMSFYDENRGRIPLPNEGEFRAYFILFHLQDPDVEDRAQSWPSSVLYDNRVQEALHLYAAACNTMDRHGPLSPFATQTAAQQDWQRFWTLVGSKRISYLMACTAEIYFNLIRRTVLNSIWRGYRARAKVSPESFTVEYLSELLCLDSDDEVYRFCALYGFSFKDTADGSQCLDLTSVAGTSLTLPKGEVKQMKSNLVEDKRFGRTLPSIINGLTVKQAQDTGLTVMEESEESMDDAIEPGFDGGALQGGDERANETEDDGESLFIPESKQPNSSIFDQPVKPFAPANGFSSGQVPKQSPFAGFSGFGKPSAGFGTSSNNTSDAVASSLFSSSSKTAGSGIAEAKPVEFNFMNPSTGTHTRTSEQSGAPQLPSFSFNKPTPETANNFSNRGASITSSTPETPTPAQARASTAKSPTFANLSFGWSATKPPELSNGGDGGTAIKPSFFPPAPIAHPPKDSVPDKAASDAFTFGQVTRSTSSSTNNTVTAEAASPQSHITGSTPAAAASSAPSHPSQQAPTEQPSRRTSLANFQPRKPSPLSHSFGPEEHETRLGVTSTLSKQAPPESTLVKPLPSPNAKSTDTAPALATNRAFALAEQTSHVHRLATDLCLQPNGGYLQQFVEYTVEKVIIEVQEKIYLERVINEADTFRWNVLAHRYAKRWRDLAWRKRVANKGRARRHRAQRALRESKTLSEIGSMRGSITTSAASSRRGLGATRREEVDAMFQNTMSNRAARRDKASLARATPSLSRQNKDEEPRPGREQLSKSSSVDHSGSAVKPTLIGDPHADLMQRSSFLGFSLNRQGLRRDSTTKTNYFKLKALGIAPEPSQTQRGTKRHRDDSVDGNSSIGSPNKRPSPSAIQDGVVTQPPAFVPRTSSAADDDALFARLKAAREKLQESAAFLKSTIIKDEEWRHSTNYKSANESPSMARARAEVRLRASQHSATVDAFGRERDVPAYRLRQSRFIPREHYAKAIERSREFRDSRLRDIEHSVFGHPSNTMDVDPPAADHVQLDSAFQPQEQLNPKLDEMDMSPSLKPSGLSNLSQIDNPASSLSFHKPSAGLSIEGRIESSQDSAVMAMNTTPEHQFGQLDSISSFPQPSFQPSGQASHAALDFTIAPSQVDESLAETFGEAPDYGSYARSYSKTEQHQTDSATLRQDNSFMRPKPSSGRVNQVESTATASAPHHSCVYAEAASQASSQTASKVISSMPDDEHMLQRPKLDQSTETGRGELPGGDTEEDSVLDDTEEDEQDYHSYGRNNSSNPFAALADGDDEQSEDEHAEQKSYESDGQEEDEEIDVGINGHQTDDDSDLEDGYSGEEEEEDDYGEEDSVDEDESEEEPYHHVQAGQGFLPQGYEDPACTSKNDALQAVGNTQEEAIELSD
nr:sac3 family protein 1 [Quercus suber]